MILVLVEVVKNIKNVVGQISLKTIFEKIHDINNTYSKAVLDKAANILKDDGLVAFPTETVYGLGANALSPVAVKKIYLAKGRPSDNPLIVHISSFEDLAPLVEEISKKAKTLIATFCPGPLTLVFKKSCLIPEETSGYLNTVAVRIPKNKIARELISICNFPIAAPSANKSGSPSPTLASHVFKDLNSKIDMIIDGGMCEFGIESTVVDVTSDDVHILRPGSITKEMLEESIGKVYLDKTLSLSSKNSFFLAPKAPGMKYRHYAPKAQITIFEGEKIKVKNKINNLLEKDKLENINSFVISTSESKNDYLTKNIIIIGNEDNLSLIAKNLFDCFHKCDEKGAEKIYIVSFEEKGIGFSIMNRLKKAASYNIVKV